MKKIHLMRHQIEAIDFLKKRNGGLLSQACGAGKTIVVLEYIESDNLVLVVCPRSLVGGWQVEALKWNCSPFIAITGSPLKREKIWDDVLETKSGRYIVGYETLLSDYRKLMKIRMIEWDTIIFDEASKIKSPTAKVSKMAHMLKTKKKVLLNATPVENSIADLWNQVETIEPGVLYGNYYKFRAIHATMNPYIPGAVIKWNDRDEIIGKCRHLIFSVPKEVVNADLPPMTEKIIPVQLEGKQARVYKKIKEELLLELKDHDEVIGNVLTKLIRLRQATNGLWAFGMEAPSAKVDALEELLDQFGNEKSLIFTQFAETAHALQKRLLIRHLITGDVKDRDEVLKDWRANGTALIGTSALSRGHNLQEARYIVFFDLPWSYASYEQAYGRAHRTGQTNPVTIYILQAQGTVDESIWKLIHTKKEDGDAVERMTRRDIIDLIK